MDPASRRSDQQRDQQGVTVYKARLIFNTSSKFAYFLNLNGKTVSDKEIVKYGPVAQFHSQKPPVPCCSKHLCQDSEPSRIFNVMTQGPRSGFSSDRANAKLGGPKRPPGKT